ncbi:hypothetical protein MEQU1_001362 [Malassezia equina]|uniref:Uncharacterized protein n=1 Tax=Malassezia equina TaxID=1381935 RepID=A0AAF0IYU5_9BASI|nr:hypothetical protein MEQU1_001362 [Malassezia equina]
MSFQAPYKYIDADSLASMLKQRSENPHSVVVVDVRVKDSNQTQEVMVLRDGFGYFGPKFKQDAQLVEDWDEESWKFR